MPASLPWLEPSTPFPPPSSAWGPEDPAPGLLAAGGSLALERLSDAYSRGIFPWFSADQPILWWSPDPRMVLPVKEFKLHRSLRKTLQKFKERPECEIRVDYSFGEVLRACSHAVRNGQAGSWITPNMVAAYEAMHRAGLAHSIETWKDGKLIGGLYCVALGQAVFGESMFMHATDASKIALAALVCICRRHQVELIDCQQNTRHLASLGAREIGREQFLEHIHRAQNLPPLRWTFQPSDWAGLTPPSAPEA